MPARDFSFHVSWLGLDREQKIVVETTKKIAPEVFIYISGTELSQF